MPDRELDAATQKLQRDYAGHVLTLRGALPNADRTTEPGDEVKELTLKVPADGVVKPGDRVEVREQLPSAPVTAFAGPLPVQVLAQHDPQRRTWTVFLVVPEGLKPEGYQVRLQWPSSRSIPAKPLLRSAKPQLHLAFDLIDREGRPGEEIRVARIEDLKAKPEEIVAVEIGDAFVAEGGFRVAEGVLRARVPDKAERGLVRVVTAKGTHCRSNQPFEPCAAPAAALAAK